MIVGIDFGTCYSCVTLTTPHGSLDTNTVKGRTTLGIPTVLAFSKEYDREFFGDECSRASYVRDTEIIRHIKRTARENINGSVTSGGKIYSCREAITAYLRWLVTKIKDNLLESDYTDYEIDAITVTAPVGIEAGQMTSTDYNRMLREILSELLPELPESKIHVLHEPVASAISYLHRTNKKRRSQKNALKPQTILVFDLGGGTLDTAIVSYTPDATDSKRDVYTTIAKAGDLTLGGNDWDRAFGEFILSDFGIGYNELSAAERSRFDKSVIKLKHELSEMTSGSLTLNYKGEDFSGYYTREQFDKSTEKLLDRAMKLVSEILSSKSAEGVTPDKVVLVGGGSNMPQIKDRIVKEFGSLFTEDVIIHEDVSKAIANGAALYCKFGGIVEVGAPESGKTAKPDTPTASRIMHTLACTYGFNCHNESRGGERMIFNLLYKDTPYSGAIDKTSDRIFWPSEDNLTTVSFDIFESVAIEGVDDEEHWMPFNTEKKNIKHFTFEVPRSYLGKARSFKIKPKLAVDDNGVVTFTVIDEKGKEHYPLG